MTLNWRRSRLPNRIGAVLFGSWLLSQPVVAQEVRVLDRVFAIPDPKATSIQFQMIVLAGSNDETDRSQQGIAHYLEHLILVGRNGNDQEGAVKFFADGNSNGSTSPSLTTYIHTFPVSAGQNTERLTKLFSFYNERLSGFEITDADAARERNVVQQERDWRYSGSPVIAVQEELRAFLFKGTPNEHSVIGTKESISAFTLSASRDFLKRWYHMNNVYFIVSGPIEPAFVRGIAEVNLKASTAQAPPERPWMKAAPLIAPERMKRAIKDGKIANDSIGFTRMVAVEQGDRMKRQAVQTIVNMFMASKIVGSPHSVLTEGENPVASAVTSSSLFMPTERSLSVSLSGVPEEGRTRAEVITALEKWLAAFQQSSLPDSVLERLKTRALRQIAKSREEPANAPGRLIGWLGAGFAYEQLATWPDMVRSVTPADVRAFLKLLDQPYREVTLEQERG